MFTVGEAEFIVGGAVFTVGGAEFTVGGAVFTVGGADNMVHEERFKGRVLQLCIFFIFFLLKVRIPPWGTGRCDSRPGLALSIVERSSFVG